MKGNEAEGVQDNNEENTPMLHVITSSKQTHETMNVAWL